MQKIFHTFNQFSHAHPLFKHIRSILIINPQYDRYINFFNKSLISKEYNDDRGGYHAVIPYEKSININIHQPWNSPKYYKLHSNIINSNDVKKLNGYIAWINSKHEKMKGTSFISEDTVSKFYLPNVNFDVFCNKFDYELITKSSTHHFIFSMSNPKYCDSMIKINNKIDNCEFRNVYITPNNFNLTNLVKLYPSFYPVPVVCHGIKYQLFDPNNDIKYNIVYRIYWYFNETYDQFINFKDYLMKFNDLAKKADMLFVKINIPKNKLESKLRYIRSILKYRLEIFN